MNDIETQEDESLGTDKSEDTGRAGQVFASDRVQNIEAPPGGIGSADPFSDADDNGEKRKTVNVYVSPAKVPTGGLQLRLHRAPLDGEPALGDPEHDPVVLKPGHNPGVDKEFFDRWRDQNKVMAESMAIAAVDEESGEEDKIHAEDQDEETETENNEHEE